KYRVISFWLNDGVKCHLVVLHLFKENRPMHLLAGKAVYSVDDDTLNLSFTVAFAQECEFHAFPILEAGVDFVMHHPDSQMLYITKLTTGAFLFFETGIVFVLITADAAIDVYNLHALPFS